MSTDKQGVLELLEAVEILQAVVTDLRNHLQYLDARGLLTTEEEALLTKLKSVLAAVEPTLARN